MDIITLSRVQFADTAAFHILWPVMSIGLSLFMVCMEALWLTTGAEIYYRQIHFWMKIFVLTFAIGVASGFPLSFQFGTNWAAFSAAAGSFFGNILGFETTVAFTIETASLGIVLFGWGKVSRTVHFLSQLGVLMGASLSAFWIMVANSWMQVPRGIHMAQGKIIVDDYAAAIWNPDAIISFGHMYLACIISTAFLMMGACAWALLRGHEASEFFLRTFKYALIAAIAATPLQLLLGHISGLEVEVNQPEKMAATELHWDTNSSTDNAPLDLLAIPSATGGKNTWSLSIPGGLSFVTTPLPFIQTPSSIRGLNAFGPDSRPTVIESTIVFYSFRVMVACGVIMIALILWGVSKWRLGMLSASAIGNNMLFWSAWIYAMPIGLIATEAGWMVREIGRQPWIMYHIMRVSDAVSSHLLAPVIGATIAGITILYVALAVIFIYFSRRIIIRGPDLASPLPR